MNTGFLPSLRSSPLSNAAAKGTSSFFSREEVREKISQPTQLTSSEIRKQFFGSFSYSQKATFGDMANVKWKYMGLCTEQKVWCL